VDQPLIWSHQLAQEIVTKSGKPLRTLRDVRFYMRALKGGRERREYWQYATRLLMRAAEGESAHDLTDQLIIALLIDGDLDMKETKAGPGG
jgi:hypothetical protein